MSLTRLIRYTLFPDCTCRLCRLDKPYGADHLCDDCRASLKGCPSPAARPPLDGLTAGLLYKGRVAAAMHSFKYNEQLQYAAFFAQYMSVPDDWRADCLVPIPLHPFKEFLRGYNQSAELAGELAKRCGLPVRPKLIKRTRFTRSQTQLDAGARQQNLAGAFVASLAVAGLSVVLVDDVATTQATLVCAAAALKNAGAKRVYAACACLAGL